MRTLSKIINICKDGGKPTIDEARLAICAMDALMVFDGLYHSRRAAREHVGKKPDFFTAMHEYEERFNRVQRALGKTPLEWLGDNNNPNRVEVQKRRKVSERVLKNIKNIKNIKS